MQDIEQYLKANRRLDPIDIFIPEQCALCVIEDSAIVHITINSGRAEVDLLEDNALDDYQEDVPAHAWSTFG